MTRLIIRKPGGNAIEKQALFIGLKGVAEKCRTDGCGRKTARDMVTDEAGRWMEDWDVSTAHVYIDRVMDAAWPSNGNDGSPLIVLPDDDLDDAPVIDKPPTVKQRIKPRTTTAVTEPTKRPRMKPRAITKSTEDKKPFLLVWRDAFSSPKGPPASTTKLVLWGVSRYMDKHGRGAFPRQMTLAADCSLSVPAVRAHLRLASEHGWIASEQRPRGNGRRGRHPGFDYRAVIPPQDGGVGKRPLPKRPLPKRGRRSR